MLANALTFHGADAVALNLACKITTLDVSPT